MRVLKDSTEDAIAAASGYRQRTHRDRMRSPSAGAVAASPANPRVHVDIVVGIANPPHERVAGADGVACAIERLSHAEHRTCGAK